MHLRITLGLVAVAVAAGGCTSTGTSPATAPPTTERVASSTTTHATTTPPTTAATTATIDRTTEVQAIFEDLEQRRLAAIHTGDTETFLSLFADTPYRERSLAVFDHVEPGPVPDITVEIIEVLRDDAECLAIYYKAEVSESDQVSEAATVVLSITDGIPKYAFTNSGRGGWQCDGPHPLSG